MKDPYEVLGVPKGADDKTVKSSYRKLARKSHPDLNPGDSAAEARFKEASAAFEVLSDPERRGLYDEFGQDSFRQGFDPDQERQYRQWQGQASPTGRPRPMGGGRSTSGAPGGAWQVDMGDLFGGMFGGGRTRADRAPRPPARGADIRSEMSLSFLDAVRGVERSLRVRLPEVCELCAGAGAPCTACGGAGTEDKAKRLKVKVPPGISDGGVIRLAGKGFPPGGDLLITIHVASHPLLQREGRDLHMDLPVTVLEAMFGAKISVPTVSGDVRLTVPKGALSNQRLRLKGKGVPGSKSTPAGDLYVTIRIMPPQVGDDADAQAAARQAAEALQALYAGDIRGDVKL